MGRGREDALEIQDSQERDPRLRRLIRLAERQAEVNVGPLAHKMGGCHAVWAEQQWILKEQFGIDWKTPAELNPGIIYD